MRYVLLLKLYRMLLSSQCRRFPVPWHTALKQRLIDVDSIRRFSHVMCLLGFFYTSRKQPCQYICMLGDFKCFSSKFYFVPKKLTPFKLI